MDDRQHLSTFAFDKAPSTMSEQELDELANKILDQWSEQLSAESTPPVS